MNTEHKTPTGDPVDDAIDAFEIEDTETDIAEDLREDEDDLSDDDQSDEDDDEISESDDDIDEDLEDGDEGETDSVEAEEPKPPKGKSRTQKRIDQLTRQARDAERRAAFSKQQFESVMAQVQATQPTQEQFAEGARQGLTPEQTQELVRRQTESSVKQQLEQERFASKVQTLQEKIIASGQKEALDRLSDESLTRFEPPAVDALYEAKYQTEIVKALNDNEELFDRFSKLPDGNARARFIDRLDGRFEGYKARKTKKTVKATPKVSGAARKPAKDPDDMSQAEYEAYAEKKGWL